MGWQEQGRQYHQWFGHGTAGNDPVAEKPFTQADLVAQAMAEMPRFLPPSMRNAYNLEAGKRFDKDLTDAVQVWTASAGLDPAGFRKHLAGPTKGDAPGAFQAVGKLVAGAGGPGDAAGIGEALASALTLVGPRRLGYDFNWVSDAARYAAANGMVPAPPPGPVILVQGRRGPPRARIPGVAPENPAEALRAARFNVAVSRLQKLEPQNRELSWVMRPNSIPSEELVERVEQEVLAAESRAQNTLMRPPGTLPPFAPFTYRWASPPGFASTDQFGIVRDGPGIVYTSRPLAPGGDGWAKACHKGGAPIPAEVAEKLNGLVFQSFFDFRAAFWKAIADVPSLASQFEAADQGRMRNGGAPLVPLEGEVGKRIKAELHHDLPLWIGGSVYDLSNLRVVTPSMHVDLHGQR